jgi:hypothetical protein
MAEQDKRKKKRKVTKKTRSAATGEYVTKKYAKKHPRTTVEEDK